MHLAASHLLYAIPVVIANICINFCYFKSLSIKLPKLTCFFHERAADWSSTSAIVCVTKIQFFSLCINIYVYIYRVE